MNEMNDNLKHAIQILKKGGLVAFPTETVYGLGADAHCLQAIQKVYAVKNRPNHHPVIVHIAAKMQWPDWASAFSADANALADAFWPGPLTLILKKAPHVPDAITGGQDTVALRVPEHPLTLNLLTQ